MAKPCEDRIKGERFRRQGVRAEGASEHASERTPRCVSERAELATRGSGVLPATELTAPHMERPGPTDDPGRDHAGSGRSETDPHRED
jgi:hypothetical protein